MKRTTVVARSWKERPNSQSKQQWNDPTTLVALPRRAQRLQMTHRNARHT
jgi:hypothetical protein